MDRVLICSRSFGRYAKSGLELLKKNNCEIILNELGRSFNEDDFIEYMENVKGMIVSMDEVSKKVLEAGRELKVISVHGIGYNKIDINFATKKGIYVTNVSESKISAIAVADLTFGLLLAIARNIPIANKMVKNGIWKRIVGTNIGKKTIGIVGAGRIGEEVIKRAIGFEMEILIYDIVENQDLIKNYKLKYTTFDYLLKNSDFICIHVPLTSDTKKLISSRELELMKSKAFLINISRGEVIDEEALYDALRKNKIAGAAIDVFDPEPPQINNPLLSLDNIITTPHYGSHTFESLEDVDYISAKNVVNVLKGLKPINQLNNPNIDNRKST